VINTEIGKPSAALHKGRAGNITDYRAGRRIIGDMTDSADFEDTDYDPADFEDTPEGEWPGKKRRAIDRKDRHLYRTLRAKFRVHCLAQRAPCGICGEPIDYGLKHGDPRAWELDHIESVARRPDLALAIPANAQASHALCNRRKALAEEETDDWLGTPSENWDALGS
jgi:hypothetical protein